jgi:hypothetical protein
MAVQLAIFMGSVICNSCKQLVLSFQRNNGMWTKKNYKKLVEEEEGRIYGEWEKLSSNSYS